MRPDDWQDMAYQNALRQEYNVSVKGGSDRASFYASLGYLNEDGIIKNSGYDRISARIKADYQAKKWLKLSANVGYIHSNQESNPNMSDRSDSSNPMYYTDYIAPIYPAVVRVVDEAGNIVIKKDAYGHDAYDFGNGDYGGVTRPFLAPGNPLAANRYNEVKSVGDQLNGTFMADISITDFLKANITSTVILGQTNYSNYQNPFTVPKAGVNGEILKSSTTGFRTNNIQSLTYFQDFGEHSVNLMVGHEYYKATSKELSAVAQGGFSPDISEIDGFAKKKDSTPTLPGTMWRGTLPMRNTTMRKSILLRLLIVSTPLPILRKTIVGVTSGR